jgi:phosphoribosylformimino-5-aminoimidazole carboxamide ribonucleotide (ProFAR) isomerase
MSIQDAIKQWAEKKAAIAEDAREAEEKKKRAEYDAINNDRLLAGMFLDLYDDMPHEVQMKIRQRINTKK